MNRLLAALLLLASACTPVARAGPFYAHPLYTPLHPSGPLHIAYRVLPPPAGCAPVEPPLIFLPALGLTSYFWQPAASRMAACRSRIVVEATGIGESRDFGPITAEGIVAALADVVDVESPGQPVVLAGVSLGGTIAIRFAAAHPERVAGVALFNTPAAPFHLRPYMRVLLHPGLWGPGFRLAGPGGSVRASMPWVTGWRGQPHESQVALLADVWSDSQRRAPLTGYYHSFLDPPQLIETHRALGLLQAPVLLVWGGLDRIVPPGVADDIVHTLPKNVHVEHVTLDGVGHLPPVEEPGDVAAALDRFVARLPAAAAPPVASSRSPVKTSLHQGDLIYGYTREIFPVVGVASLFPLDGRMDLQFNAGIARGSVDPHWPLEAGRLALTVGAAIRDQFSTGWSFAYLTTTARMEMVWRWGGGFHLDGTLLVDPRRGGNVGGYGALGYTPSIIPWLRVFTAYGALPYESARLMIGVDVTARLTGWMF